jgi:hypothetical protein
MSTEHENALRTLEQLEAEQRERYRPAPVEPRAPRTPAEAYLDKLNASLSKSVSVDLADAGWLR